MVQHRHRWYFVAYRPIVPTTSLRSTGMTPVSSPGIHGFLVSTELAHQQSMPNLVAADPLRFLLGVGVVQNPGHFDRWLREATSDHGSLVDHTKSWGLHPVIL